MVEHELLQKEFSRYFPVGHKSRDKAMILLGIAIYQIESAEVRAIREFKDNALSTLKDDLKQKLKEKLRDSKEEWITVLRKELKEEMIDNL